MDQEEPCPTKTIFALMIIFFRDQSAFVARLLPMKNLSAEFLYDQIRWLIFVLDIIHKAGGTVVFVMIIFVSINTMFKLFHENQTSFSVSSVVHLVSTSKLISLHLIYDPTHALQNIRNNWVNEKNQTLSFTISDTNTSIKAKWNDIRLFTNRSRLPC